MLSTTQRSKRPWKVQGELVRGSTALQHPRRSSSPRDSRVLSHDTDLLLKVNGRGPGVTSSFPLRAQNIRYDTQVWTDDYEPNPKVNGEQAPDRTFRQPPLFEWSGNGRAK